MLRSSVYLQRLKFAMHNVFIYESYVCKCFAKLLNSQGMEFANISENKVLANKSELTVVCGDENL